MLRSNQQVTKYDLNEKTRLKVVNLPDEDSYKITLSLSHKLTGYKPLEFSGPKEIADFIAGIDYEDDQLSLLPSELPSKNIVKVRAAIKELFAEVSAGKITVEDAMIQVDGIVNDWVGPDDNDSYPFPVLWDINQRKNWVSARNHIRRSLRADYKG
jgi:hypothetical protein